MYLLLFSEMHRTQSDFDDNLTFKVFIFQFINFYSSIIYIAFFKGKFVGYPGAYINIVGNLRNEDVSLSTINNKTHNFRRNNLVPTYHMYRKFFIEYWLSCQMLYFDEV